MQTNRPIRLQFLEDGGQTAESIAATLADFIGAARSTLDIAIYDLRVTGAAEAALTGAVAAALARGVEVRVVFNQDHPPDRPLPPPSEVDWSLLDRWGVSHRAVSGVPDLMHHKFVIRDGSSLWTGSMNWTMDSWTREENVIVELDSTDIATDYRRDFEDLWQTQSVARSGHFSPDWVDVGGSNTRPVFSPGRGQKMSHEIAHRIAIARRRVRIASPVLTSGPILGTLAEVIKTASVDLAGVYDRTQMVEVGRQWAGNRLSGWKRQAFDCVVGTGRFGSKVTTPYGPGSVHDYMHAKMTVADDTVFVGSYNLSHSGEMNAENVLEIESPELANEAAAYIERLIARYPPAV